MTHFPSQAFIESDRPPSVRSAFHFRHFLHVLLPVVVGLAADGAPRISPAEASLAYRVE